MSKISTAPNRIAELREARGWRLSHVAAAFDLGERTIRRWETGETPVPSEQIPKLANLFEVNAEYLMGWDRQSSNRHVKEAA